jgi:hypothetical protein
MEFSSLLNASNISVESRKVMREQFGLEGEGSL